MKRSVFILGICEAGKCFHTHSGCEIMVVDRSVLSCLVENTDFWVEHAVYDKHVTWYSVVVSGPDALQKLKDNGVEVCKYARADKRKGIAHMDSNVWLNRYNRY